jgi:hypothetical protein
MDLDTVAADLHSLTQLRNLRKRMLETNHPEAQVTPQTADYGNIVLLF